MTTQKPETRANWKSALSALATGLCLLALVACGGSESQGAQESRQDRLLAAMPKRLSGEPPIEVMPISGEVWLQTYESAYQFGLRVNVRKWLEKLDRDADDIAVAWSRSRLIWVVGYSVDDVPADRLIPTFLASAAREGLHASPAARQAEDQSRNHRGEAGDRRSALRRRSRLPRGQRRLPVPSTDHSGTDRTRADRATLMRSMPGVRRSPEAAPEQEEEHGRDRNPGGGPDQRVRRHALRRPVRGE